MTNAFIAHVIASALLLLAAVLIVAEEGEFAGLVWQGWAVIGLFFHALGHWIPGGH